MTVAQLRESLAGRRLCVIGDLIVDEFVHGHVDRISPEAPVPVVVWEKSLRRVAAAGGAAAATVGLCRTVEVVGAVGRDAEGNLVRSALARLGARTGLVVDARKRTPYKVRVVARGQHIVRVDRETTTDIQPPHLDELMNTARHAVGRADAVLICDYAKGTCVAELVRAVIDQANSRGIPVVVDPKHADVRRYAHATAVTPNEREMAAFVDHLGGADGSATERVRRAGGFEWLVVTRADRGATITGPDGTTEVPAYTDDAVDVAGAGDALAAVFALCLGAGVPAVAGLTLGALAAGLVVGRWDNKAISMAQLTEAAMRHGV